MWDMWDMWDKLLKLLLVVGFAVMCVMAVTLLAWLPVWIRFVGIIVQACWVTIVIMED